MATPGDIRSRGRGPGDYLAVTANYDLFKLKFLPALLEIFEGTTGDGRYWSGDRIIELRHPTKGFLANRSTDPMWGRVILRSAESKGGLESSTALAALLDEAGMPSFTAQVYQAIRRRLSIARGRVLVTTTLYILFNWLRDLYDRWQAGDRTIDVINFDSTKNPAFSREEYEEAIATMPEHVINMQYRGIYDNPPGMIYDTFNAARNIIKPIALSPGWPVYLGMDYGGANTAAVRLHLDETSGNVYLSEEYLKGQLTAEAHAGNLRHWNPAYIYGGSWSEGQWRREFRKAGMPVQRPLIGGLWEGINIVYSLIKTGRLKIFDTCTDTIAQMGTYARPIDKATGQPIQNEIINKQNYHYLDAIRYPAPAIIQPPRGGARKY